MKLKTEKKLKLPSDQDISGRTFGEEELKAIEEVIRSGVLITTKGRYGKMLEEAFAKKLGVKYAYACSSGSAAVHAALAAINPEPGDEIVTTPITDMGAITPIIYQGAIPVFADVCPKTLNVTAETIEKALSERTRAIIVTHLFGNPCEMEDILKLAESRKIPIIEDCAQAFLAQFNGRYVGTIGAVGTFSFQQGKHMSCGEGGIVVTNDDSLARRIYLFINKAWGYGDPNPDHYFLALNYRMSELQAAVAFAQLGKLDECVKKRIEMAQLLDSMIADIDGVSSYKPKPNAVMTYWKYCLRVDDKKIRGGATGLAKALKDYDIFSIPRYIQKPAYKCRIFQEKITFGNSSYPFNLARSEVIDYNDEKFKGAIEGLSQVLVLPFNERYEKPHIQYLAISIREAVESLRL
ncbi:MAG: DegT/DnrJ/EryC1/StrS family aminotransferase [Pyrinomonadaceae bacterium]|nr:DegT/DnrJ/EryC1/StrS family aminotransferase [Pyrinomonadaceae bacterium]MCX7638997.1 DegT/DnrJ/EryC1/StrS family aminotransferase [Pyrinomonadaceae bacterium]MDW8303783.1 DegT/DnrJ/EryC1/StrS family aminotransferase [Acidobacteriota bacterium]